MANRHMVQDGTGIVATVPGEGTIIASGRGVPADGTTGYTQGCIWIDPGAGLYVNTGTVDACAFLPVSTTLIGGENPEPKAFAFKPITSIVDGDEE